MTNEEENKTEDAVNRAELTKLSVTEKKTLQLIEHRDFFEGKFKEFKDKLVDAVPEKESDLKTIEGRDIKICIRARPLLP